MWAARSLFHTVSDSAHNLLGDGDPGHISDLGLSDAADVRYFRFAGIADASEFLDLAVFLASSSLLVLCLFHAHGSGHISDGSGHLSDLEFSGAAVPLARPLADKVLSDSWSRLGLQVPCSPSPPEYQSLPAALGSLLFVALSLSLFILSSLFIFGLWVSRMTRRLLFQRPFDAF